MANFICKINGQDRELRRLRVEELVVLSDAAYQAERQTIIDEKQHMHDVDAALEQLRAGKGDPFMLWKFVKTFRGSQTVLQKLGLNGEVDDLTREQTLQIVGEACGFDVEVRKDAKGDETRPPNGGTGKDNAS